MSDVTYLKFLAVLAHAREVYSTGGIAGASAEIKQMFDMYDALRERGYLQAP